MGVAEVGGPVPSAQHGMEEIDSKLRSILWKFICQFMCDKFIFSIFFFFYGGGMGYYKRLCFTVSVQVLYTFT